MTNDKTPKPDKSIPKGEQSRDEKIQEAKEKLDLEMNIKEQEEQAQEGKKAQQAVERDFQGLLGSVMTFMANLLNIKGSTDHAATKESIIADIPFRGHNTWILACSIFIASIGLNANSTAVVIGAMLISPLMGPILGMGLSLATNDIDTLKRSLKNFAVMVVVSVVTAFLFFYFFPLQDESSELLARTAPDIRDVLIAFFGGLALAIARAKRGTIASVIFGVAIATALMPPLCTVGFGLAIGNWSYASGAMYLFVINTIFIALATFLVIKYLGFPMVTYANSKKRRNLSRIASLVALLVMVPASFTFWKVFQKSRFMAQAETFVNETIGVYQFKGEGRYMEELTRFEYDPKGTSVIEVVAMGNEEIPSTIIGTWKAQLLRYSRLGSTELHVVQGAKDDSSEKYNYVRELYESKKAELLDKDAQIALLETELAQVEKLRSKLVDFPAISQEAKVIYDNLENFAFFLKLQTNYQSTDTIPVFEVAWKEGIGDGQRESDTKRLQDWLKLRVGNDKIQVMELSR